MSEKSNVSRRKFLAASAAVTAPLILPAGVLAQKGRPGANDKIVMGFIGVGGKGRHHVGRFKHLAAAVCDVDQEHLQQAVDITERDVDRSTANVSTWTEITQRQGCLDPHKPAQRPPRTGFTPEGRECIMGPAPERCYRSWLR